MQIGQWILLLQLQLTFWIIEKVESAVCCSWVYLFAFLDNEINCALCPHEGGWGCGTLGVSALGCAAGTLEPWNPGTLSPYHNHFS